MKKAWLAEQQGPSELVPLTGAIPLLLDASTLSCWVSPLARIALHQTTWLHQHSCSASILTPSLVRTLVQRGQASRLVPCGTASSCLSLPDAWITEPATDPSWSGHVFFAESCIQGQFGSRVDKTQADPDVIRTRSLLIWSQTRYRCATESLLLAGPL